ncbi:CD3337/EF1877 family mobilome membrane protein [Shouchella miscanthi]|uniref:Uncharacterized protein n=1 Tax=Shouchella miscanthi TaxID=2598861 RepID=A0ABU6NJ17_9BACI|nr:hypothetical protein [Shouchella miscanthi]
MRRGKKFAVLLLILLFFAPKSVSADDAEYRISESGREQGGVELDSQRYPYEHYSSITHTEGSWVPWSFDELNSAANGLADMFFSLTKNISSLIDSALAELYAISVVERLIGTMTSVGEALYDTLFSSIGTVLFVIAVLTIFVYFVGERNASKAGKATLKLIFVVGITAIWMANASDLTRTVNSWSNELQAQVMTVGTFLTDEEIQEGNELEGSQALLRNYFFDLTVYKPYLIMNYGSTDEEIINENNPDRVITC